MGRPKKNYVEQAEIKLEAITETIKEKAQVIVVEPIICKRCGARNKIIVDMGSRLDCFGRRISYGHCQACGSKARIEEAKRN